MEKKKRSINEIINAIYRYLEQEGGEVYVSNLRSIISNPSTALEIIRNVQERPYLYFKEYPSPSEVPEKKSKKKYTILKLSSHKRNPKHRYLQLDEVISYLDRVFKEDSEEKVSKADLMVIISRTIDALNRISNRIPIDSSFFI